MLLKALPLCLWAAASIASQFPLQPEHKAAVTLELFADLERASRLADIAYCVAPPALSISKPFDCLSRCSEFPGFELLTTWHSGPLLSDSAGFVALDHNQSQIVVVFRGTYSITNAIVDLSTVPQEYAPYPGQEQDLPQQDRCNNCTVHVGFSTAWQNTKDRILPDLLAATAIHPSYGVTIIGHSLGGAVAMLAALELQFRGFRPIVTTFGEPRVGNQGLVDYLDRHYHLNITTNLRYRRITHLDDPIPLLPLTEWGFAMHAGEIFISKPELSPDLVDLQLCVGDADPDCIASQDSTARPETATMRRRDLLPSIASEVLDIQTEPWGIPSRYKLWQLVFAHRDYFHRLGLCVPTNDPVQRSQ